MVKLVLVALLPLVVFLNEGADRSSSPFSIAGPIATQADLARQDGSTGTLEKMIVANGTVALDLDLKSLGGSKDQGSSQVRFEAEPNSFFTTLVFNGEFRGPLPGSMPLIPQDTANLPARLGAPDQQLVLENMDWGGQFDLVVRDQKSGFIFFNVEGQQYTYDADTRTLGVEMGRLLLSNEYAKELGLPAGTPAGSISVTATLRAIEVSQIVNGEVASEVMPSIGRPEAGTVPGPDVIVGDLSGLAQFGTAGTQVGLAVGTDSCNFGVENLHWFANPDNDHPVIPQNLYRMSGGATNDERFEQIGQSQVKHAFTALTNNICGLGCNGVGGTNLGSGCSDPYSASLNAGPSLGSRAWINPFTGFYPRNDSATPNNNHTGHTGDSTVGHRIRVEISDLATNLNPGATYYAESQYVTPHEYVWCQSHPGQCNMNNNVSFRRYNVTGTGSPFSFSAAAVTQRTKAAITAWTGATIVDVIPDPNNDGVGAVGYKVTNPSAGVWHYEYAIYNQNMDRGIQSFSVPVGSAALSNIGFHAPPQHPGYTFDGTVGNAGYSSTPWASNQSGGAITWASETFAQNQNANAIRWGTLYNFRFDSNVPPQTVTATIGFYKTGAPITVQIQGPSGGPTPTPTNTPTATPTSTPTNTPTATPTATPTNTPTATPTATPTNTPTATPTATPTPPVGWEGDVSPRPNGDGFMNATDVIQIRRFATGLDTPGVGSNEAQRADSAPLATNGDGTINAGDVIQARRFATGLDPMVPGSGPTAPPPSEGISSIIDDIYSYFFGREIRVGNSVSSSAKTISVPIEITTAGDEAGVSFTLEYDVTKLSNPRVELGDSVPEGSVLTVNANEAGRIGILVDSPSAFAGAVKSMRIVMVTFDVSEGASGETAISFTGSLAAKGAADSSGNTLPARSVDGIAVIPVLDKAR